MCDHAWLLSLFFSYGSGILTRNFHKKKENISEVMAQIQVMEGIITAITNYTAEAGLYQSYLVHTLSS